jgi:tripartite ATP-independent transporter DctM subunit
MGFDQSRILAFVAWGSLKSYGLAAIPLFVFMGEVIFRGGLSRRVYSGIAPLMDHLPGGILHSNIAAGAVFAAASGSSLASTATIGTLALPEMYERGYSRYIAKGSVLAGGALGILIPPSVVFIIYGIMVEQSIGRLFIAGIIPGILLALMFMLYIGLRLTFQPHLAPKAKESLPLGPALLKLLGIWPILILIIIVLGSIYGGIATPTEAAAMGCFGGIILVAAYRQLSWKVLRESAQGAVRTCSMTLLIFTAAKLMGALLTNQGVFQKMMLWVVSLPVDAYVVFAVIMLMYLILGMFMSGLAAIVITLPIVFPIIVALGFDPIWFGVVIVLQNEMGLLTPPVGSSLYVLHGLRPSDPFDEVARGSLPFVGVIMLMLIILVLFPELALWLPGLMYGT